MPLPNSAGPRCWPRPAGSAGCRPDGHVVRFPGGSAIPGPSGAGARQPRGRPPTRIAELPPAGAERGPVEIVVRRLVPGDVDAVAAMIERCSPATLYRRFHGVTRPSRAAPLLMAGAGRDSFGAWIGDDCVAVGGLVPGRPDDCNSPSGHIGVLVEDAWQRKGVGSALVAALVVRAREQGLAGIVADIQAESEFLRPMLGRIGPTATSFEYGGYTICVDLAA